MTWRGDFPPPRARTVSRNLIPVSLTACLQKDLLSSVIETIFWRLTDKLSSIKKNNVVILFKPLKRGKKNLYAYDLANLETWRI
jgi:hypothetical protein